MKLADDGPLCVSRSESRWSPQTFVTSVIWAGFISREVIYNFAEILNIGFFTVEPDSSRQIFVCKTLQMEVMDGEVKFFMTLWDDFCPCSLQQRFSKALVTARFPAEERNSR